MQPCNKLHLFHANIWVHADLAVESYDKETSQPEIKDDAYYVLPSQNTFSHTLSIATQLTTHCHYSDQL